MASTGLLVVSNLKTMFKTLSSVREYVNSKLYVDLNLLPRKPPPQWHRTIQDIYMHTMENCPNVDVRVLVSSLKVRENRTLKNNIDVLLLDHKVPEAAEIQSLYKISQKPIYLSPELVDPNTAETKLDIEESTESQANNSHLMYDTVVLGGTFDRMHVGHKILLNEAVLRARKRLVVGVTAPNMLASKKLHELISPLEKRLRHVREFLEDIDNTLQYEVVAIEDFMGPTRTDPDMGLLIVSTETYRSGQKINEVRISTGLKPMDIYTIPLYEEKIVDADKEKKVSSSNYRMDVLGIRIRDPEPRTQLPKQPYIIGLTGGIASGKSKMAARLERRGAKVINCDTLAHQIYEPDTECYRKLIEHFGNKIVGADNKIDRKALGEIVFSDHNKLEELNQIIWPTVLADVHKIIQKYREENVQVVIVEAALLLRAGWDRECHEVWSMIIPPEEAIKRLQQRNRLSEVEAKKRIDSQMDNLSIVQKSNIVFSSLWSEEFSSKQADRAWELLSKELKF